jgi:hypothetical protein
MRGIRKRAVFAGVGVALCLGSIGAIGVGAAGASTKGGPLGRTAAPRVYAGGITAGTYDWVVNDEVYGTITFESGDSWTTDFNDADGGYYVEAGKSVSTEMTTGGDADSGCIFAGKASKAGTSIGTTAKPGEFVCSNGRSGTWEVVPEGSVPRRSVNSHGNVFRQSTAASRVPDTIVPKKYPWFINGEKAGKITFSSANTFTSTLPSDDAGYWVEAGSAITLDITSGTDTGQSCLFAGKVSTAGTSIGTSTSPGTWICPGYGSSGTWRVG